MSLGRLLSVNVGLPRDIEWKGRTVYTGIWKDPLQGRCRARRLNLDGDGQGDKAGHGGEQRAVFVYQIESYRHWENELKRNDFVYGQFGENFTIEGLPDDVVCIGDRYQIGSAIFEVTQLCLKSRTSVLDTVSTGSDSDLVNHEKSKSLGNIAC